MKTHLFLIVALFLMNMSVSGANPDTDEGTVYDTLVIKNIMKELYMCTCKPNTANPNGEGKVYFQGILKKDFVTDDADYHNCDERFLIQWDLSELPDGINIIEAKMELFCTHYSGDGQGQLIYEYITESWNQDIGFSKKPETSVESRIITGWPEENKVHCVDMTNFIKNWVDNRIPNYGLMGYSMNTETTNSAMFGSSKFPDESLRPKLTIIYQVNRP